jgi:dUTP pyrophosphatase
MQLSIFKTDSKARIPVSQTAGAACLDVSASLLDDSKVTCYDRYNIEEKIPIVQSEIKIKPFSRALIPTNLILDIPVGYSVRVHPRSGLAVKQGLTLVNCEGVVDSDYVNPLFIAIINLSAVDAVIRDGDRIAQLELYRNVPAATIFELATPPSQKTDRTGGFGSTGV